MFPVVVKMRWNKEWKVWHVSAAEWVGGRRLVYWSPESAELYQSTRAGRRRDSADVQVSANPSYSISQSINQLWIFSSFGYIHYRLMIHWSLDRVTNVHWFSLGQLSCEVSWKNYRIFISIVDQILCSYFFGKWIFYLTMGSIDQFCLQNISDYALGVLLAKLVLDKKISLRFSENLK